MVIFVFLTIELLRRDSEKYSGARIEYGHIYERAIKEFISARYIQIENGRAIPPSDRSYFRAKRNPPSFIGTYRERTSFVISLHFLEQSTRQLECFSSHGEEKFTSDITLSLCNRNSIMKY